MKKLDYEKDYKVSGEILYCILDLQAMYQDRTQFNREEVDYTIGKLCSLFEHSEWEEV